MRKRRFDGECLPNEWGDPPDPVTPLLFHGAVRSTPFAFLARCPRPVRCGGAWLCIAQPPATQGDEVGFVDASAMT
jgi:hypothetical protein